MKFYEVYLPIQLHYVDRRATVNGREIVGVVSRNLLQGLLEQTPNGSSAEGFFLESFLCDQRNCFRMASVAEQVFSLIEQATFELFSEQVACYSGQRLVVSISLHALCCGEIGRERRSQYPRAHEMQSATATFRNGRVELTESVDWPDGTEVEVTPLATPNRRRREAKPPMTQWPDEFFDRLRELWGEEPFERPPQGEFEVREDW